MKKVIVITGASSGIGEATAKMLAKDYEIVLAARREDRLKTLVEEIETSGGEAVYQVTDVSQKDQVEALAKFAIDTYGQIDVWINNAGIMPTSYFKEKKVKEWDAMIDINIKGTLYGIASVLPRMQAQKSGQIINVASVQGLVVSPGMVVYSATKFAVHAISEGLRQEVAADHDQIRVTTIYPGAIATELVQELDGGLKQYYEQNAIPPDRVALAIKNAIEMPDDTGINDLVIRPVSQVR